MTEVKIGWKATLISTQTLLGRILNNLFLTKWLPIYLTAILFSCRPTSDPLPGDGLDPRITALVDSFPLDAYTVLLDKTISTSNTGNLLSGNYTDPIMGKGKGVAYFQLFPPAYPFRIPNFVGDTILDSVKFYLTGNTFYPGIETTEVPNVIASEKFSLLPLRNIPSGSKTYLVTDSLPSDSDKKWTQLGLLAPKFPSFALYAENGMLFDIVKSLSSGVNFNNDMEVLAKIPGLCIVPEGNVKHMYTFRMGKTTDGEYGYLKIKYRIGNAKDSTFMIARETESVYFSNLVFDRNGTLFKDVKFSELLSSSETGGKVAIQQGSGVRAFIKIPDLKGIQNKLGNSIVISAQLEMKASQTISESAFSTVPSLALIKPLGPNPDQILPDGGKNLLQYLVNEAKDSLMQLNSVSGRSFEYSKTTAKYSCNITGYFKKILKNPDSFHGLLVSPFGNAIGVQRSIFDNSKGLAGDLKIKIFYRKL